MAGRPRGRKRARRNALPKGKAGARRRRTATRGLRLSVSPNGHVLDVSLRAPKPDNWNAIKRFVPEGHPPPEDQEFTIPEPALWSQESLWPAFRKLFAVVRRRATKGVSLKLHARFGERADTESTAVYFPGSEDGHSTISQWSQPFKANASVGYARRHFDRFLTDFYVRAGEDRSSYGFHGYIYRVGIALLFNKRPYRKPKRRKRNGIKGNIGTSKSARKSRRPKIRRSAKKKGGVKARHAPRHRRRRRLRH
jgi:hypothetical protein